MKYLVLMIVGLFALPALATFQAGDSLPNFSWTDANGQSHQLTDSDGNVRVLIYDAGFCGPCNDEVQALLPRVNEFAGQPVVFISVSVAGYSHDAPADAAFLQQWQNQYNFPFLVVGTDRKELALYSDQPGTPTNVIVSKDDKLVQTIEGYDDGGIDTMFAAIKSAL